MRPLADIESAIAAAGANPDPQAGARELLALSEEVLEHWVTAKGGVPTDDEREGFRLLALHRQGAKGDPSFNACRETCREVAYHYNLITLEPDAAEITDRLQMMKMISSHLYLFTSGKLQVEWTSRDLKRLRHEVRRANRRNFNAILGTGLLISAAIIYGLDGYAPLMALGAPLLAWLCAGLGLFLLVLNWPDDDPS